VSPLDGISSVFRFEGVLRDAILRFKYRNARILARSLAESMAIHISPPDKGSVLVPVPLHNRRLRARGYNQSALLVSELAKLFTMEFNQTTLERVNDTPPQARQIDAIERRRNLKSAFKTRGQQLAGRSVIIVDDVCTTGATLESCAEALRDGGARTVNAVNLAREV
jgi:ComF family protein